jgi:hypothetical protein
MTNETKRLLTELRGLRMRFEEPAPVSASAGERGFREDTTRVLAAVGRAGAVLEALGTDRGSEDLRDVGL